MKFSSLAALEVVKMAISSATSDANVVKMTIFSFYLMGLFDIEISGPLTGWVRRIMLLLGDTLFCLPVVIIQLYRIITV